MVLHWSDRSGSLRRRGAYDLGRRVSERIDQLKTADVAAIEMGLFFLCEVDGSTCESTDVPERNVTSCSRKSSQTLFTRYFLGFSITRYFLSFFILASC